MAETIRIRSICGSLRKASYNAALRRALPTLAPDGMSIEPLDGIAEMPIYDGDIEAQGFPAAVEVYAEAIRDADGIIVCTPEYNHSVPGGLKNTVDWLSRLPKQPFSEKPLTIMSVSGGQYGGARSQISLRTTFAALNALVLGRPQVAIGPAKGKFDESTNELTDEKTRELIAHQLAAFDRWVRRLMPR